MRLSPGIRAHRSPAARVAARFAASGLSSVVQPQFEQMVEASKKYIAAGDIFQVVLSQRFERNSPAE